MSDAAKQDGAKDGRAKWKISVGFSRGIERQHTVGPYLDGRLEMDEAGRVLVHMPDSTVHVATMAAIGGWIVHERVPPNDLFPIFPVMGVARSPADVPWASELHPEDFAAAGAPIADGPVFLEFTGSQADPREADRWGPFLSVTRQDKPLRIEAVKESGGERMLVVAALWTGVGWRTVDGSMTPSVWDRCRVVQSQDNQ